MISRLPLRRGFTLIELLVVIAIIAVLIGLLLPAVQKVREAANNTRCKNHLHQLGVATHNYYSAIGTLPPSKLADDYLTWAVLLLPYVEQDAAYRQFQLDQPYASQTAAAAQVKVPFYFCPSRRSAADAPLSTDAPKGGLSDYAVCSGTGNGDGKNANGVFIEADITLSGTTIASWKGRLTLAGVVDGTSSTFLFGDKHVRPSTVWGKQEDRTVLGATNANNFRRFAGAGPACVDPVSNCPDDRYVLQDRGTEQTEANRSFGSRHLAVCNMGLCDGSVRTFKNSTDLTTLSRLASRLDGLVVTFE